MANKANKERYPLYLPAYLIAKVDAKAERDSTNRSIVVTQILKAFDEQGGFNVGTASKPD